MRIIGNNYETNYPSKFNGKVISKENVVKSLQFAYDITYGMVGKVKENSFGTNRVRGLKELFENNLQGKLAEFGVYQFLTELGYTLEEPSLWVGDESTYDDTDLVLNGLNINIKASKPKSQLLLIETNRIDENGKHIIKDIQYDLFTMVRVSPDVSLLNFSTYETCVNELKDIRYEYQILGWTSSDMFSNKASNQVIKAGSRLNGCVMETDNYYLEERHLHDFNFAYKKAI